MSPFSTIETSHLKLFLKLFYRLLIGLWCCIFLWLHLLMPLSLWCPSWPIPLNILLSWPILKVLMLHMTRIWASERRTLLRHVHRRRRGLWVESVLRLKVRWRESKMRRVVRVPPILIILENLSTPVCPTGHATPQDLSKGFTLTFAPNLTGEGVDLGFLTESISRLDQMKIANPKHLGCPEIISDLEHIWRRLANPRRQGVGNPPLLTEEIFNPSFCLVFLCQHKPGQASPTLSHVDSSLRCCHLERIRR
jgi:hypothetical protein